MARRSSTNSAANAVDENMNDKAEAVMDAQDCEEQEDVAKVVEKPKKVAKEEPLRNDDIIEVMSLVPNVGYKDKRTADLYKWEVSGEIVEMPFDVINYMWQTSKSFFRNMWLKPLDNRVVKKFSLESIYRDYDYLMDVENYTRSNVRDICNAIRKTPPALKSTICNKVKSFVSSGELSDVHVLREIEKSFNIDLVTLIE